MLFNKRPHRRIRRSERSASDNTPKIVITIVAGSASLILIILLTVLLGNNLRNRADTAADTTPPETSARNHEVATVGETLPTSVYDPLAVPVIKAEYVKLSSSAGIDWSETATTLKKNNIPAAALVLYYGDGIVNFSSPVAQRMGFQPASTTKTSLFEALGVLKVANIYSAGCFYVTFHKESSPTLRSVLREYEAALISEAVDAEISDVTLFGFGLDNSTEAALLVASVRKLEPDAVLGVALPASLFDSAQPDRICTAYAGSVDYLALDLSSLDATSLRNSLTRLGDVINKYNMRIMVSDTLTGVEDILAEAGISNWMKVPQ